jgi:branched-chain amino acid transport system permease protein
MDIALSRARRAAASARCSGVIVGLPALRLRTFYFAMTTLGFATIVTQIALAWKSVTGGGIGTPGPVLPWPFDPGWGFYYFCLGLAALCTWMTANIAAQPVRPRADRHPRRRSRGRSVGHRQAALLMTVFLFSGALAGVAGGLFASLQSYITPDAFTFDLSVLFFIAILIGGRGSILGPLLGTIMLTVLPEIAAPLVAWSTFLYAVLLLVIVLADPRRHRRPAGLPQSPAARAASRDRAASGSAARAVRRARKNTGARIDEHRAEFRRRAGNRRARSRDPRR